MPNDLHSLCATLRAILDATPPGPDRVFLAAVCDLGEAAEDALTAATDAPGLRPVNRDLLRLDTRHVTELLRPIVAAYHGEETP